MAPTLYHSEHSAPSRSVRLIAKAIGLDLNLKELNLFAGEHLKPEFLKLNPQHTIPTLTDEDGFSIWESHAIGPYLVSKYATNDSLYPSDLRKRAIVDQRLHFNNGTLVTRLTQPVKKISAGGTKEFTKQEIDSVMEAYSFLEKFLERGDYVAGNQLTVADFSIITIILVSELFFPITVDEYPKITAWIDRIKSLPYFNEVNEKGSKGTSES